MRQKTLKHKGFGGFLYIYICIYICMYIYIYREREGVALPGMYSYLKGFVVLFFVLARKCTNLIEDCSIIYDLSFLARCCITLRACQKS